jgi:FkbM family methyltransferase
MAEKVLVDYQHSRRQLFKKIMHLPRVTRSRMVARLGPELSFALYETDLKLAPYLDKRKGFFVELGANDGLAGSNTKFFECYRDWTGVLIEPVPSYRKSLRLNRKSSNHFFHCAAVGFEYEQADMKILQAGLMSTPMGGFSLIANRVDHARAGMQFIGGGLPTEIVVPARTLDSMLTECNAPRRIDFLSLDVEGGELEVLNGIDHNSFRFNFALIEAWDQSLIMNFMSDKGYVLVQDWPQGADLLFRDARTAGIF